MADGTRPALPDGAAEALAAAVDGLALLIRLADREADRDLIAGLRKTDAAGLFAALMPEGEGREAAGMLADALDALATPDAKTMDDLAADYAETFLTHTHRISPHASVWMTDDHLERQGPMFEMRDWYAHWGFEAPNWRLRSDDHMVHALQFVSALLGRADPVAARDAAKFLDAHVLPWLPEFGRRMAPRVATPLMAAVGGLLATYPLALRDLLTAITGREPRIAALPDPGAPVAPDETTFLPGAAPSW